MKGASRPECQEFHRSTISFDSLDPRVPPFIYSVLKEVLLKIFPLVVPFFLSELNGQLRQQGPCIRIK